MSSSYGSLGRAGALLVIVCTASCSLLLETSGLDGQAAGDGGQPSTDGSLSAPRDGGSNAVDGATPHDASPVADADAGPTGPCNSADLTLRLCVTFEDAVKDESFLGLVPATATGLEYVPGHHGKGALLSLAPQSNLRFSYDPAIEGVRTVEAWIKPLQFSRAWIVDVHDDLSMLIDADGTLRCRKPELTSTITLKLNEWNHVACTLDGATLIAYVNGAPAGSVPSDNQVENTAYTGIGQNSPDGTDPFFGVIDDLRFWGTTRSPAEIAAAAGE